MKSHCFLALALLLICPLRAEPAPFAPDKQFSADQIIQTKEGMKVTSKVFTDNGKIRTEMNTSGMDMVTILRTDEKKMYSIMPAQKMVMEMTLDPKQAEKITAASGDEAKFELAGSEVVEGTPSLKYKMTSKDGKIFFWWVNAATKTPVKMAAEDGTFTLLWKNYKVGPQDAALFEVPAGYQVMKMPSGMSAPAGP